MTPTIETINNWSAAWWSYFVHAGWQGAVVGTLLLGIVLVGRRWPSPLRHALLLIALLKFVAPPFAALPSGALSQIHLSASSDVAEPTSETRLSELYAAGEEHNALGPAEALGMHRDVKAHGFSDASNEVLSLPGQESHADMGTPATERVMVEPRIVGAAATMSGDGLQSLEWTAYLMFVHAGGVVFFLCALVWQAVRLHCVLRQAEEIRVGDCFNRFAELGRRLGIRRLPRLLVHSELASPFSCGAFRAATVLPSKLLDQVRREEMDLVLAHELAHHRRRDLAINWLQALVHVLWWFHPVVWLVNRRLRTVREDCCDDLLLAAQIADETVYCDTLLHVAACAHGPRLPRLALQMGCGNHGLFYRFRRLMDASLPCAKGLSWCGLVCTLVLAAVVLPGLSSGDESVNAASDSPNDVEKKDLTKGSTQRRAEEPAAQPKGKPSSTQLTKSIESFQPASDESRAWYILRQTDTQGLLNALPLRLSQANVEERRSTPVWQGIDNGARLKIRIDFAGEVSGEVLVGFFADSNWEKAEPAQVRSFPGPGEYTIDRLMPGKYWVGAMVGPVAEFAKSGGSLPKGTGLGVDANWPRPLELLADQTAPAHVRVSNNYRLSSNNSDQLSGHFGLWGGNLDQKKLVTIRTLDTSGQSVPFCGVTLSELIRGDDTRIDRFHGFGTDEKGLAYCDKFLGRFTVSASKFDSVPELFTSRYRFRGYPTVYEIGKNQTVEIPIDPIPTGTGTVSGRVHDQFKKPLTTFYLSLRRHQQRVPFDSESYGIEMPFTSATGTYSFTNTPPGRYSVLIRHFDYPTHVYDIGGEKLKQSVTVPGEPNARVEANFEVEAKELLYGRAVFDDATPVTKGSWIARFGGQQWNNFAMNLNDDGTFRVAISAEEKQKIAKYFQGAVQVSAYRTDGEESTVDVRLDKLSRDLEKPATVVIPSKAATDKTEQEKETKTGQQEGLDEKALAWISDLKVLGADGRTVRIADFRGKPLLLNLFGPWCQECVVKMPELVKLHEQFADKGLVVLLICTLEDSKRVDAFAKEKQHPFLVATDVDGYAVDVFRKGRSEPGYPTNVVLDRNHKRLMFDVGFGGEKLKHLEAALQKATAGM